MIVGYVSVIRPGAAGNKKLTRGEEGLDYWGAEKLSNGNYKVTIHHIGGNQVEVRY